MSHHRVSLRLRRARRHENPADSQDPRVLAVLDELARLPAAPGPRPEFRAELRAQLVAIAPRIVEESRPDGAETADGLTEHSPRFGRLRRPALGVAHSERTTDRTAGEPSPGDTGPPAAAGGAVAARPAGRLHIAHPLRVVTALLVACVLLLGGAVWMSRGALPGDALYGLKRTSERVQLAFDTNDTERARDHLAFAATRVDEARKLLSRPSAAGAATVSSSTAHDLDAALDAADTDTRTAARMLGDDAVDSASGHGLSTLTDWTPGQQSRLRGLWSAMPAGALRDRATSSLNLLRDADDRADSLARTSGSGRCTHRSDSLGPLPCPTTSVPSAPGAPSGPKATSGPGGTTRSSHAPAPKRGAGSVASHPRTAPRSTPTVPRRSSAPGTSLPLPKLPKAPASIGSCGAGVTVGPLKINVPLCPSSSS